MKSLLCILLVGCGGAKASIDTTTNDESDTDVDTDTDTDADADTDTDTDTDADADTDTETTGHTGDAGLPDVLSRGPYATVSVDETVQTSCAMAVTAHVPAGIDAEAVVVLAHGFARDRGKVADLADHMASWGLAVVRPNLCHGGPLGVDHPQNGADLAELAAEVADGRPVVLMGHSAGGLAALLAIADTPLAVSHLGLDTVDASGLGLAAAPAVGVPSAALLGIPQTCNSQGNAVAVYEAIPDVVALRLPGADHCDFESPTNGLCTSVCGNAGGPEPETQEQIIGLATAWALGSSGLVPEALGWWEGPTLDGLVAAGVVERVIP